MSKINLPSVNPNERNVEVLVDKLTIMRRELEYALMHLDRENVPVIKTIDKTIAGVKKDTEGNTSSIIQNAEAINLRVEKDDIINQINISNEGIGIDASKLNITAGDLNITAGDIDFTSGTFTVTSDHIALDGITRVANEVQIGKNDQTGVINFPKNDVYNQAFISSDNGVYGLYIFSANDVNLTSNQNLELIGQDSITVRSQSGATDKAEIILDSGVGISFITPTNVDFNSADLVDIDDLECNRIKYNGSYAVYGVKDTNSINFYDSSGASIGGINFSTGVIYQ